MMAAAREWLTAVAAVTLLLSVAQLLVPPGNLREIASFVGGLILLAAMMQPLLKIDLSDIQMDFSSYQGAVEQRQAELENTQKEELTSLIEAETEAYISGYNECHSPIYNPWYERYIYLRCVD